MKIDIKGNEVCTAFFDLKKTFNSYEAEKKQQLTASFSLTPHIPRISFPRYRDHKPLSVGSIMNACGYYVWANPGVGKKKMKHRAKTAKEHSYRANGHTCTQNQRHSSPNTTDRISYYIFTVKRKGLL